MLRRILKNIGALTFATALSRLLSLFITVYLARTLTPETFGSLALAQAIIAYFALLTDLGLKIYAIREMSGRIHAARSRLNHIFSLRLLLGIFAFLACVLSVPFFPISISAQSVLLRMSVLLLIASATVDWIFYVMEEMEWVGLGEVIQNAVLASLIFLWIKDPSDLERVPWAFVASTFCAWLFGALLLKKKSLLPKLEIALDSFRIMLSEALPLGMSLVLNTLYLNLGQIMLGFMKDELNAGLYAAAYKFINFGILGLNIVIMSFYPALTRLHRDRPEIYFTGITLASRFLLVAGLAVGFLFMLSADRFIALLYGADFAETGRVFSILIWSFSFMLMRSPYDSYFLLAGKQRQYLKLVLLYFCAAVLLNVILIHTHGLYGAALATVLSDLIFTTSLVVAAPRELLKNYHGPFAGIVLSGVLFLGLHLTDLLPLLPLLGAFVVAMLAGLFSIRFDFDQWKWLRKTIHHPN
jgi:O-antigen/teichoic acid export membrane protein